MSGRPWEAGDVAALLANPIYAIEIHPSLSRRHSHFLSETQWIDSNERAIAEWGRARWLSQLLAVLQKDHSGRHVGEPFEVADPYPAITVHPTLCTEHELLINEAKWVKANIRGMEEGEQVWMRNLLTVLMGAYV
jgi:hypothetical protein